MGRVIFTGARFFDGAAFHEGQALVVCDGRIEAITPLAQCPEGEQIALKGGVLAPGLVDLQVNGGGGVMLGAGDDPVQEIATICTAHAALGTTSVLPTLITTSAAETRKVLAAGVAAVGRVPGFLGLHLEGPHLDPKRPGCHPAQHIRPMDQDDLETLCEARAGLPALKITLAPAAVTPEQIARLTEAGVVVFLGHAECSFAEAQAASQAGARGVTHLFNAMSQLGSREPGLVGAALSLPFAVGLIADGIHVAPETAKLALQLAGDRIFLVTDAMAAAGTDLAAFDLAGQRILRADGALRTENGTLAGADLSLPQALRFCLGTLGLPPAQALAMMTARPADVIGARAGRIAPGYPADLLHFTEDWQLARIWQGGAELQAKSPTA
ncbi:N-acetylglucosamine 6-phosphate deacetylase [Rhodobacter aestuarii]|uniref:N-acetylglucosamine 6-phosphate deacetylase n=1 Tax=Rhodobacter aestuarii TaxID=453582 RepID=A0A1N7LMZ8_9RHOB|nr:N-acetylglucosamine-6-phosphate deacetylase [Rhodobacter aestuarii]PTV95149.1 N-acetylglucosamine 6-phosphate deacetylase [Rhodobacter aestuarii]SIS75197.1 N-acetylglucosamine 6-phosphate deacetylase [Rhodobacter aestuarii]